MRALALWQPPRNGAAPKALASTIGTVTCAERASALRGVEICFRVFELGCVIPRIKLHQQGSRLYELVVLDSRIDIGDGSADSGADQVQMPFNLGVVGGFVVLRVQPPKRSARDGDREDRRAESTEKVFCWGPCFRILVSRCWFSQKRSSTSRGRAVFSKSITSVSTVRAMFTYLLKARGALFPRRQWRAQKKSSPRCMRTGSRCSSRWLR